MTTSPLITIRGVRHLTQPRLNVLIHSSGRQIKKDSFIHSFFFFLIHSFIQLIFLLLLVLEKLLINVLHEQMRHEGQNPNSALLAHHPGPVDRVQGDGSQRGTIHPRNLDMVGYVDNNLNRIGDLHRGLLANGRIHNMTREIKTLKELSSLGEFRYDELVVSLKINCPQVATVDGPMV